MEHCVGHRVGDPLELDLVQEQQESEAPRLQ